MSLRSWDKELGLQSARIECRPVGVSDWRRMGTTSGRQRKVKEAELYGVKSLGHGIWEDSICPEEASGNVGPPEMSM